MGQPQLLASRGGGKIGVSLERNGPRSKPCYRVCLGTGSALIEDLPW